MILILALLNKGFKNIYYQGANGQKGETVQIIKEFELGSDQAICLIFNVFYAKNRRFQGVKAQKTTISLIYLVLSEN